MQNRILLAGFQHTAAQKIISLAEGYDVLLLPSDKVRDAELLKECLRKGKYDLAVCIGQKPRLKNKVCIETTARSEVNIRKTAVNCEILARIFSLQGLEAKLSDNAGTSFCNEVYLQGLRFAADENLKTAVVFVHVPFCSNIRDPDEFYRRFLRAIDEMKTMEVVHSWKR